MDQGLVRPAGAIAWELRTCWAKGWRVALTIDGDVARVEGIVEHVSPTGALAIVSGLHVPLGSVLAVHRPSRLGDSDHREKGPWRGKPPSYIVQDPNQLRLW